MKRTYVRALFVCAAVWACTSCVQIPNPFRTTAKHDPDLAASDAVSFAKESFIDLNQPTAYGYLISEGMRRSATLDQYISTVGRMHPTRFPKEITAAEYEPAPGPDAFFIWLDGTNGEEHFYYRLRMEGTSDGYKVGEMLRVDRVPASQSRKQLKSKKTTVGLM